MKQKLTFRLWTVCICLLSYSSYAQVVTQHVDASTFAARARSKMYDQATISPINMPSVNAAALIAEDKARAKDNPGVDDYFRFGKEISVSLGLENAGKWVQLDNGDRIWLLKIKSKGAHSINLIFDKFSIPEGGELYIYNGKKTMFQGPITSLQNNTDNVYANDLLQGESVVLEYYEPSSAVGKSQLSVSQVVHGYVDTFNSSDGSSFGFGCSQPCNRSSNDVKCPMANNWQTESDGVAIVLQGGSSRASGFLVNNTSQNKIPYFLLSIHQIPLSELQTAIFRFHYKSPTCNGGDGPTSYFVTGADQMTQKVSSDLQLVRLKQTPSFSSKPVAYLGWSILANVPTATTVIHHPVRDVMKIATGGVASRGVTAGGKNVWQFYFNDGITEQGSSGSPTFDQNRRVIGVTHGAPTSLTCTNFSTTFAYSGRLDVAWDVLCPYLDPTNSGTTTLNTLVSSPVAKASPSVTGPNTICTTNSSITLSNAPTGTITWTASPASRFTPSSGTGATATLRAANNSPGTGTITFTYNSGCGTKTVSRNINTNMSPVRMPQTTYYGPYATIYAEVDPVPGALSYEWYLNGQFQQVSSYNHEFTVDDCGSYYTSVRVRTAACSWSALSSISFYVTCSNGNFTVYPNPANEQLTIEQTTGLASTLSASTIETPFATPGWNTATANPSFRIELYDDQQKLVAKGTAKNAKIQLDTSKLPAGAYYLQIYNKEGTIQKQVIIE